MFSSRSLSAAPSNSRLRRWQYWFIALVTALSLVCLNGGNSIAQSPYPPFLDPHVNDYGQVLRAEDAAQLRRSLQQFQAETGIQVVVVTVNSMQDYRTGDVTFESFATNLFNFWGIGDRTRNDGILILLAPGDRKVRIELGRGYGSQYDQVAQDIINAQMIPHFKEENFSQGAIAGANAVVNRFNPAQPPQPPRSSGSPPDTLTFRESLPILWEMMPGWLKGGITGVIGLIFSIPFVKFWLRHRQRKCPECGGKMVRLDEKADDQYLDAGQRKEESLRSVDYDVWHCPACGHHQIHAYNQGRYHECPACHYRTLELTIRTVQYATYSSTGQESTTENCHHCSHHHIRYETTPMLTRDDDSSYSSSSSSSYSSSDSSSGDGGSSSGGGASGSW